jgi:pyruvyltransferase
VNNFGDLLGPLIVQRIRATQGLGRPARDGQVRLLTAGSIMRMARPGDVIWGTGVNGKSIGAQYSGLELDIRAVRGPLTRDVLERNGHRVPRVCGDPVRCGRLRSWRPGGRRPTLSSFRICMT